MIGLGECGSDLEPHRTVKARHPEHLIARAAQSYCEVVEVDHKFKPAEQVRPSPIAGLVSEWAKCERGVTAMEYALIAALVAVVAIAAVTKVGTNVRENVTNSVNAAN
jgi:pilus assembly protein Flp/PilA